MDNIIECPRCGFEGTSDEFEKGIFFNFVTEEDIEVMMTLLESSSLQVTGLILGHINRTLAGEIFDMLPEEIQVKVIKKIGNDTEVEFGLVQKLERSLRQKLNLESRGKHRNFDNVASAKNILYASDAGTDSLNIDRNCPRCGFEGTDNEFEKGIVFNFVTEQYIKNMVRVLKATSSQITGLILGQMDSKIARDILKAFPANNQKEIIRVIGKLTAIEFTNVQKLERLLRQKLSMNPIKENVKFDGIETVKDILLASEKETQDRVVEELAKNNMRFLYQIMLRIFSETIGKIDELELISILQDTPTETITYAMKDIDRSIETKILDNLPKRRQHLIDRIKQGMPYKISISVAFSAQRDVIEIANKWINKGRIK